MINSWPESSFTSLLFIAISDGSGETAQMCSFARSFAARLCDLFHPGEQPQNTIKMSNSQEIRGQGSGRRFFKQLQDILNPDLSFFFLEKCKF